MKQLIGQLALLKTESEFIQVEITDTWDDGRFTVETARDAGGFMTCDKFWIVAPTSLFIEARPTTYIVGDVVIIHGKGEVIITKGGDNLLRGQGAKAFISTTEVTHIRLDIVLADWAIPQTAIA